MIESYLIQLRSSFGGMKVPAEEETLRKFYDQRKYPEMVLEVKTFLKLDMPVRVGLVNKGGPKVPAWVITPPIMPVYGTQAFRETVIHLFLRKAYLAQTQFEQSVIAIAHELSHVVLNATYHSLRVREEAVDLTAMLLGFRDFYITGCETSIEREDEVVEHHLGYLSREEVDYAAWFMTFR